MMKPHKTPLSRSVQVRLSEELLTKLNRLRSTIEANSPKHATVNQSALLRDLIEAGIDQLSRAYTTP